MPWSRLPTPDATGDLTEPVTLGTVLDRVLAGLDAPKADAIVAIHERWSEVVGEELAERTSPISIEDATLRIGVDSPAWAGHLRWAEADILRRVERVVGAGVVTSVQTRVVRS
ncbi:MAG: DUF721 domain-containing protein [Acidimicrobiales bacterium]|nr:DUF721 domain-containing protein [Acidimicrobiales bacterium]MCB1038862.1 DUF721 domain-containing protein [Acidimicrobiales bacterium]